MPELYSCWSMSRKVSSSALNLVCVMCENTCDLKRTSLVERRYRVDADDGREARRAGGAEQEEIVSWTVSVPNFRKMRALALRDS